ncbi:MAG TPA: PEP-CTERM sorting domain-containing protein [Bryobacteraceae bacterium]
MTLVARRSQVLFSFIVLTLLSAASAFGQCGSLLAPSTTANAGAQDFNTAADWSSGAPNSTTNACIINGSTVTLAANQTGDVGNLQVNAGNTLNLSNNTDLFPFGGQIINGGAINAQATVNDAIIGLEASTTLSGAGTLTLSETTGLAIIQQQQGGLTLNNQSNIVGAGLIGNGGLTVNNTGGTINASTSAQTLEINASGGVTNGVGGLLTATNSGTLQIDSITIANAGGNITANGGAVVLNSTTINGGTLTAENGGTLSTIANGTATLNGVTINGTYTSGNNTDLFLGATTNTGTIALSTAANDVILGLTASTTLGNTVTMTQTGTGSAIIEQQSGGLVMTNAGTIEGAGVIGNGGLTVINNGTINANGNNGVANANPGQLTLFLNGSGGVTNNSLIEATNNGTLQISSIAVANAGGNITANGGAVVLNSATINGGTLTAENGGTLSTIANGIATLNGVTINGTYSSGNNTDLLLSGTITNNGTIALTTAANNVVLGINANTTLSGGNVTMTETGGGTAIIEQQVGGLILTNNGNISGAGIIGNGGLALVNNGTVNANSSGQTLTLDGSGGVTNNSVLEATGGGTLFISSITVDNSGGSINGNGGTVEVGGNATIQGGQLLGTLETAPNQNASLDGATNGPLTIAAGATYTNGNNSDLFVQGAIVNNGSLNIAAGANNSIMGLLANTTLSGTGALTLSTSGGGTAIIEQQAGGLTLTNQSTIQGTGIIGNGGLTVVNGASGTLLARDGDSLTINGSGGLTNTGTMQVNAGGTMTVTSALSNFSGGTLTGGTYIINGATGNNGVMQITSLGSGGGEITTNAANITLNGPTANTLFEDNTGNNPLSALASSTDKLTVEGGYAFNTSAGTFTNGGAGFVIIGPGAGSSFSVNGGAGVYNQSSILSTVLNGGTLNASTVNVSNGLLQGTGTVNAPATTIASGGTLSPGSLAITSGGTISFTGALTLQNGSAMNAIVAGTAPGDFGVAAVTGALTINAGASLDVVNSTGVSNGSTPIGVGTQLTIMTSGGLTGGFSGIASGNTFDNGLETWTVAKVGNTEVLNATLTPGDVITATYSGPTGNWTTNSGNPDFTTNWSCNIPVATGCVPNNGTPATAVYAAVINSDVAVTLDNTSTPSSVAVNSLSLQEGSLNILAGATLNVTGNVTSGPNGFAGPPEINLGMFPGEASGVAGGNLTVGGLLSGSALQIFGFGTISGTGSLSLTGTAGVEAAGGTLNISGITNNDLVGGTLTGGGWTAGYTLASGTLKLSGDVVTNSAYIALEGAGSQILDPSNANALAGLTSNQGGTLDVLSGASLTISGPLTNENNSSVGVGGGTLNIGGNLTNDATSSVSVTSGALNVAGGVTNAGDFGSGGTLTVTGQFTNQSGGTLGVGGTSTLTGGLENAGTVNVAGGALLEIGAGPFTGTSGLDVSSGTLAEDISGSTAGQFGFINVGNGALLESGADLTINLEGGYDPSNGTKFNIVTYGGTENGGFTITDPTFNGGTQQWTISYTGGDITLTAGPAASSSSVTATWGPVPNSSNTSGNWTTATEWGCTPGPVNCVPNNGAGTTYAAILDSTGNTLTLNTAVTVNSVDVQSGQECATCGLALSGGNLTATDSFTIDANGAVRGNGTITSPSFSNNTTVSSGGVYADLGILDLSGSTITNYNPTTQTLTGGVWQAGLTGAGTLKLPGNITTNSALFLVLNNPGSEIVDALGNNALANTLTSNNAGALDVFDGATLTLNNNFTNGNGSAINDSFGGSALTINGGLTNSGGSAITVNGSFGGATLTVNGNLNNLDTSTIELSNSGLLTVSNPAGPTITNNGTITDGGTLSLTDSGNGHVGTIAGTGTLTLQGGALTFAADMNLVSSSTINGNGTISGGTYGVTNFDNQGTLMPTTGTITLNSDFNNDGQVTVNTGNTLVLNASSHVGNSTFQNATILINGGTLTDNSFLDNGLASGFTGTLTIEGGGTGTISGALNNGGIFAGSNGVVTVTGAGSSLTATGGIIDGGCAVGCGTGKISVLAGGLLTSGNQVLIADGAGSTGSVLINGASSELNTTGNDVTIGTGGTVTVSAGGTLLTDNGNITTSGAVTVGNGGTISMGTGDYTQNAGTTTIDAGGIIDPTNFMVNGGTAQVDGSLTATTVSVANGAELTGNGGTITGNLINDGTLSPGTGAAPGTLTVNGNVNLTGATGANDGTFLELIAGLNNFGVLDDTAANGTVTLGGTLDVMLLGGYQPVVGNTFTFIDPFADNGIFTTLDLPNAPAGDEYIVQYNAANTELCFVSAANPVCGSASPPPAVPEPKSVVLLGTVIAAALWYRRRRNAARA